MQELTPTARSFNITGIGAKLKSAREALHLTKKDAANRLHLNVKFIDIMEDEDFENGPPATFIRGYIRSYARILNFSESEIDHAIEKLSLQKPEKIYTPPKVQAPPLISIDHR